ncbi:2-keto-4-pentenoate hydratase [Diaphorobacter caeni]|uniref:2-keto-4-pentenoate hydratase n=1 Tax=Diaphorobacter caeni TaxID=2784387 RepID=UPI00188E5E23|nr:fumarylacetoacetate hydrolase [Diaphorobacter caeni]MBF5005821.1 fumarylacetoacetate hydrolase [Diaphorobacter caeni]
MKLKSALIPSVMAVLCVTGAQAQCLNAGEVAQLMQNYVAMKPSPNIAKLTDEEGACSRARFNELLSRQFGGKVIGYKAGLTNPAVQQRFGTNKPVWGVLYDGMILPNDVTVQAKFGARPLFEADMLVRVKSENINAARNPAEVLENIDQIIPFIELPDLMVENPGSLNGAGVAAINVGARLGVVGEPINAPVFPEQQQAMLQALAEMAVQVSDNTGAVLSSGKGSDILGHPLNAVVWLAGALQQENLRLRKGDLISLGSFSPLTPPKAGTSVIVTYQGLPGAKPVQVNFRPPVFPGQSD